MILQFVYYLLIIGHVICLLSNRKSSLVVWASVLVMAIMFYANDATYGDHVTYIMDFYNLERIQSGDPLYTQYMILISNLGIKSYQLFLLSIYVFECVFIGFGVSRFTKNYHAVFALCMMYIFPFFAVGLRYSMAMAVFIFSLKYWNDRKYIYAILLAIIASNFHICLATVIILLPTLSSKIMNSKYLESAKLPFWPFLMIIAFFVIYTYLNKSFAFKAVLESFMNEQFDERGVGYLDTAIGNGIVIMLPAYLFSFLLSYQFLLLGRLINDEKILDGNINTLCKFNYMVNVLSGIFYVLFCITPSYLRLLVIPSVLNAIVMGVIAENSSLISVKKQSLIICFMCLIFSWIIPIFFKMFNIGAEQWIETTLRYFN